jgi:hypothetical protein
VRPVRRPGASSCNWHSSVRRSSSGSGIGMSPTAALLQFVCSSTPPSCAAPPPFTCGEFSVCVLLQQPPSSKATSAAAAGSHTRWQ